MELVGIRIKAGVINLDFETEIHRHEMRIRISLAIGIGEAHEHTGVVVCSRSQPFELENEVCRCGVRTPKESELASRDRFQKPIDNDEIPATCHAPVGG